MADPARPRAPVEGIHTQGDRLETLYRQHQAGLLRFVNAVLRDRAEADDVVQATFAKAAQSGQDVEPAAIKSWLYRVAFHEAVDRKRRQRVDKKAKQRLSAGSLPRGDTPQDALVRSEVIEQVRRALEQLPENQQRVVRMRVYEKKTFAQISQQTGMPLGTVLTHMRRALEKLRHKLPRKDIDE